MDGNALNISPAVFMLLIRSSFPDFEMTHLKARCLVYGSCAGSLQSQREEGGEFLSGDAGCLVVAAGGAELVASSRTLGVQARELDAEHGLSVHLTSMPRSCPFSACVLVSSCSPAGPA